MFNEENRLNYCKTAVVNLKNRVYTKICDLQMTAYTTKEPVPYQQRKSGNKISVLPGESWGQLFDCAWFHATASLPEMATGKKVVLVIDLNGEGLVYDAEGNPFRAITNINSEFDRRMGLPGKRIVPFSEAAEGGDCVDVWIDAGCNDLFGVYRDNGTLKEAWAAVCDEQARTLYYDLHLLALLLETNQKTEPRYYELLDVLFRAVSCLNKYTEEEYRQASAIAGAYYARVGGDESTTVLATGHAHIDLGWRWPIRETRRKGARTFSTALDLMERYPGYIFGSSQAQLYQWIKEDHPVLYERVKKRIQEDKWELQGAMWVESDTNLAGGESLVRQFLYGNRYWKKEFGQTVDFAWLPDVFGYTAALPQIMKKSGIDYFSTIKLSWNEHNRFPYTNFYWTGLDGSKVLVHMPPEGNYLSEAAPCSIKACQESMAISGQYGEMLLPFGIGDGGGGPSPYHLEYLKREEHLPGMPPVQQGMIRDFFARMGEKTDYPEWRGELYLEKHQGTYTTAARNKRYNRKMEFLLRDTEFLSAMALRVANFSYPQQKLEDIWKEVLLYQFHDILPGSSIDRVYEESEARYEILMQETTALRNEAINALAGQISTENAAKPKILFNTLSFPRTEYVKTDSGFIKAEIPAMGYTVIDSAQADKTEPQAGAYAESGVLENDSLVVKFGSDGSILSMFDKKRKKEMLAAPSNRLLLYPEKPEHSDAWDFPYEYRCHEPEQAEFVSQQFAQEDICAVCRQQYRYGKSDISLELRLQQDSPLLLAHCEVDWKKENVMLRLQFAPNICFDRVDCDIQFGNISRSTQNNTGEELAQYEIPAHKWVQVNDINSGFALLNDCKYGYYAKNGILEMNVLRSTFYPAEQVDRGHHEFNYALFINNGVADRLETIKYAYELNVPLIETETEPHDGLLPQECSLIAHSNRQVIIESVKKAEDNNAVIVRSYEALGVTTQNRLEAQFDYQTAKVCNLSEIQTGAELSKGEAISYRPFDIVTVALE